MEPIKSNLEPIEESDLNLEAKLKGGKMPIYNSQEAPKPFYVEKEKAQEVVSGEKDNAYGNILAKVQAVQPTQSFDPSTIASDAQAGLKITDADSQVQHLVDIAQQKGVVHAVKVAQHMENNYILDTFHDRMLADELHDALVQKGMIKEI